MREFFRGWKRKIGDVTLLVGCVSAAGWVRRKLLPAEDYTVVFSTTAEGRFRVSVGLTAYPATALTLDKDAATAFAIHLVNAKRMASHLDKKLVL